MKWQLVENNFPRNTNMFCLCDETKNLFNGYAMATDVLDRRIDTRTAVLLSKSESDEGIELVYQSEEGLVLTEKLTYFNGVPCAQCFLSDAEGNEVETRDLVPLVANSGGGEIAIPLWWNHQAKQLLVPFDNDNWYRYEALPLRPGNISYELTVLIDEDTREGVLFGAIDFDTWKNGIINNVRENRTFNCTCGVAGLGTHDALPHGTMIGKSVASSRFVVMYGEDWRDLLEQYGDLLDGIREPLRWHMGNPFGFNAFAGLARKMSNEIFDRTGDFMYNELMPRGFQNDGTTFINLDGGWQRLDDEPRLASKKKRDARGQKNGVYDGSFSCRPWGPKGFDEELPGLPGHTYSEILLRDEKGRPLPTVDGLYAFDVTHPVWREFTKAKFDSWKAEGYNYCKLDFLTHGCMEGVHYDKNVRTGRQAIEQGYRYIASLVDGSDGYPMFCSISIAPVFPYGFAHARRSSCDTFGTCDHIEYVLNALTYSWWENKRLYDFNDADHLVLYRSFSMDRPSTDGEAKARFTTGVISGGVMLLSDDFDDPNAQARAIKYAGNAEVNELARSRVAFRPVEINGDSASHAFTAKVGGGDYMAVFTWKNYSEKLEICLDRAGLEKGMYRDLWTGDMYDGTEGSIRWNTEGCDCILLKKE